MHCPQNWCYVVVTVKMREALLHSSLAFRNKYWATKILVARYRGQKLRTGQWDHLQTVDPSAPKCGPPLNSSHIIYFLPLSRWFSMPLPPLISIPSHLKKCIRFHLITTQKHTLTPKLNIESWQPTLPNPQGTQTPLAALPMYLGMGWGEKLLQGKKKAKYPSPTHLIPVMDHHFLS